jgi:phosphatidyl-myo-inositol alpha-mannosyltransferase
MVKSQKLKIGIVCPYNMFRGGGVQECVLALREGLQARGHRAHIVTPQPRDYTGPKVPGMIMIGGGTELKTFFSTSGQVSASVDNDSLEEMLEIENFDVLHFHEPWNPILSRQILTRSSAIHIGTFHAALPDKVMTKTIQQVITPYTKSILKYLDVMTAVSPAATMYVKTLTNRRLHIIANGIDLSKYKYYEKPVTKGKKQRTIFYIGRLERRKGLKYLIDAFAMLHRVHPHYRLVIAGDGPEREKLETYIKINRIKGVEFLGFIDESTKLKLFHDSDIFCSPAIYGESFGIVLLEAMASGCVVVAGNNAGYESVLRGSGQISLVNPKDVKEFARRLLLLASDEGLRKHWRTWAKNEITKYDYNNIIDQYESLFIAAYNKKHNI